MISNFGSGRRPCRAANSHNSSARHQGNLQFETLEPRRVLTTGVFDVGSGLLEIEVSDVLQSVISHDGQFVTIDGSTDLDPGVDGLQQAEVADLVHLRIRGTVIPSNSSQSLVLQGNFDQTHAPNLVSLVVTGLNHVVIDGTYDIGHHFTVGMVNDPSFVQTRVGTTANARLTVNGPAAVFAANGHTDFAEGTVDLRGPLTLWTYSPGTETSFVNTGPMQLDHVRVFGDLRVEAPEITDPPDAWIGVTGMTHLKSDSIRLGESNSDLLDFRKLNFKSTGDVNISDDNAIELIGASYAEEVNLVAAEAIHDAIRARTNITGLATFTAPHVGLGERGIDEFNAGSLTVNSTGHVHISEDSDMLLSGKNSADSMNLLTNGTLANQDQAIVNVAQYFGVQANQDILIGTASNDVFSSGTVYFAAPNGKATIHENGDMHILESKNIAMEVDLLAEGDLTDSQTGGINVTGHAQLAAGGDILLGDSKYDLFNAGSVNFNSANQVLISENSDMLVTDANTAGDLLLASAGVLTDNSGATTNVPGPANLSGNLISMGHNGLFESDTLILNSRGAAIVHQAGDMLLDQNSRANIFHLSADGVIENTPGSTIISTDLLDVAAQSISMGLFDGDMLMSGGLQFNSAGEARIAADSDILLQKNSFANAFELISSGDVQDAATAEVIANTFASVHGVDVILGDQDTDCFMVNSGAFSILASGTQNVQLDSCSP